MEEPPPGPVPAPPRPPGRAALAVARVWWRVGAAGREAARLGRTLAARAGRRGRWWRFRVGSLAGRAGRLGWGAAKSVWTVPYTWWDTLTRLGYRRCRYYLQGHRGFRRWRWAYLAWLQAYNNDNLGDEVFNPEASTIENWVERPDGDPGGDYGEEMEYAGQYWSGQAPDRWEGWWDYHLDGWFDESGDVARDLLFEEVPYHVGLLTRPVFDLVVRLPVWGCLDLAAWVVQAAKAEWQARWTLLLVRGGWAARVAVLARRAAHLGVWAACFVWGVNLIPPDGLELFVTYTCGGTFHPEYHLVWWALVFGGTTWAVGPAPLRGYLFRDLGVDNVGFTLVAATALGAPEQYHPTRPWGDLQRRWVDGQLGYWKGKPWWRLPTEGQARAGGRGGRPHLGVDPTRPTPAEFEPVGGWFGTDLADKDWSIHYEPTRAEVDDDGSGAEFQEAPTEHALWHRHPGYYRNNLAWLEYRDTNYDEDWYDAFFLDTMYDADRNRAMYHNQATRAQSGTLVEVSRVVRPHYAPRRW